MATDTDDELSWLQQVPNPDHRTTIRLASAQAQKADQDGDKDRALEFYRTAAEGWSKLPPNAMTLNNGAIVQWRLFNLTGDITHYENGTKMMEQAVALQPDDSILAFNAATSLLGNALLQIAGEAFHPRLIQAGIDLESLRFLYQNEQGRSALFAKLRQNSSYRRGLDLLQRSLVLAPNNLNYHQLASVYFSSTHDTKALQALLLKVEDTEFSSVEAITEAESFRKGEKDDEIRKQIALKDKEWQEIHDQLTDPKQRHFARVVLAETRLSVFSIGEADPKTIDSEIAYLQSALKDRPSSRLRGTYLDAVAQQALLALSSENEIFAEFVESGRRDLSGRQLLLLALYSDRLRPLVLAHGPCKKALQGNHEQTSAFPDSPGPEDWMAAAHLKVANADAIKASALKNQDELLAIQFHHRTTPWVPSAILRTYQALHLRGEEGEAKALLQQAAENNIPLPKL